MSEILDKVVEIVCNQLSVNKEDVTPDASFVEDLGADSLDTVELVMAFEEEFGLEIPDDEAENITTIKSAVDWFDKNSFEVSSSGSICYFNFCFTKTTVCLTAKNTRTRCQPNVYR